MLSISSIFFEHEICLILKITHDNSILPRVGNKTIAEEK